MRSRSPRRVPDLKCPDVLMPHYRFVTLSAFAEAKLLPPTFSDLIYLYGVLDVSDKSTTNLPNGGNAQVLSQSYGA